MFLEIKNIKAYQLNEYLLIIRPHEDLRNKIMHVKQEFAQKFKNDNALFGKPHLALAKFSQFEMAEERMINKLKTVSMGIAPVKIELSNYGNYPSHTVFINVASKSQIESLVKPIRSNAQHLMIAEKDNKPQFMLQPHFTIGLKLLPWQFEKASLEYGHRHFTGRFIVEDMLLLKRKKNERHYIIADRFEFKNMPVSTTQGALF